MPIVLPRLAAVSGAFVSVLLGLANSGCKRPQPAPGPAPSAGPSVAEAPAAPPEEVGRCRRHADFGLTLDADSARPPAPEATEEEEDDALLPFGVDIGAALGTPFGFAAAGIRGAGQAFVALIAERKSHRIDLGQVHGDSETPAIAALGERVFVALRSTDAAGYTIKVGDIAGLHSNAVVWGHELSKLGKQVTAVQLAVAPGRGVLVYQGELKGDARLMLGTFSTDKLAEPFTVKALDAKDVEMPRLLARAGGYWLSWVRTLPEPKKPAKISNERGPEQDPEEREILDVGLRVVEVVKLGEDGQLQGSALRIGEPRRQVLLYDVAALSTGGLLLATRSDSATPGAEGGAILLSEVGPDGSVQEQRVDDDDIGAGAPSLLSDASAAQAGPWLVVSAPSDATRVGLARGARSTLVADAGLGRAELLAVNGGRFLAQRARGRSAVLEGLDCSWPVEFSAEKK